MKATQVWQRHGLCLMTPCVCFTNNWLLEPEGCQWLPFCSMLAEQRASIPISAPVAVMQGWPPSVQIITAARKAYE